MCFFSCRELKSKSFHIRERQQDYHSCRKRLRLKIDRLYFAMIRLNYIIYLIFRTALFYSFVFTLFILVLSKVYNLVFAVTQRRLIVELLDNNISD